MKNAKNKKIKIEHVDRLSRGQKSGANIGSRAVGHHLRAHEREKYERAIKIGYLEITDRDRENLWNLWEKVCQARDLPFVVLVKQQQHGLGLLQYGENQTESLPLKEAKQRARELIT